MEAVPIGERTLSHVVAVEQVTDDTIATRNFRKLIWEIVARSRALEEVLDAVDMSRRVAGSQKRQDSLHALLIFRCGATRVLLSNKT